MNSILITLVLSCILVSGIFFINNNNNSFNHNILINANGQEEYYNDYNDYYYDDYDNRYNYLPQEQEYYEHNYYNDYGYNTRDSQEPQFISIQNAQSGSISEINTNTYMLELNDVSDKTILFSDRPDRIVTSTSTENFVDSWNIGTDSFALVTPNAVLIVDDLEEQQDLAIVELFNPVYDEDKKTLSYEIIPDDATSIELPSEFGQITLIIDPDTIAPNIS